MISETAAMLMAACCLFAGILLGALAALWLVGRGLEQPHAPATKADADALSRAVDAMADDFARVGEDLTRAAHAAAKGATER